MKDVLTNTIVTKSWNFAVRCVKLKRFLNEELHEYDIAKQILRSGTSIGANIKEAQRAQSKADFRSKMNISLKEASETEFWIDILLAGEFIDNKMHDSLKTDCVELIKILTSIVKNTTTE